MVKTSATLEEDCYQFKMAWGGRVDRIRIYEEHSSDGKFGSLEIPRPKRRPCVMPIYELLVYDDGKVARCNHDWDGEPLGDLWEKSMAEIWHGSQYEDLRRQHQSLNITDLVCAGCDSWYPEIGVQGTGEVVEK